MKRCLCIALCFMLILLILQPSYAEEYYVRKDPTLAAVLSIIGPALGPLYNGEFWKKAPAMIIALGIGYGVLYLAIEDNIEVYDTYVDVDNDDTIAVVGVAFILTTHILAPIDAYKSAKRINEENRKKVSFAPMIRPKSIGAKFSLVF